MVCTNGHDPDLSAPLLAQLDELNIPVLVSRVRRMVNTNGRLTALELEDGMLLDCERLLFSIGHYRADDLAQRMGCERNDDGCVVVDDRFETTVPDVYAAGDITPGTQIALVAAAGGATAAVAIHHSLLPPELRLS